MFLEIKGIKKNFGEGDSLVEVLKGIDLSVEKGEFCVLLGPSGSGKSTLLNIIGGIDRANEGSITDRKSTRLNSSHLGISYAGFCWKKKKKKRCASWKWKRRL